MNYTFKDICKELNKDFDFSKSSSELIQKAAKAAQQLEFCVYSINENTIEIQEPSWPYTKHQYTDMKSIDELSRAIVLTHAILNYRLHDVNEY